MSQARKKKLRRRERRRLNIERKRHELFDGAIKRAGLESAFRRIPQKLSEILRSNRLPTPQMQLDAAAQSDPNAQAIVQRFGELIYEPLDEDESGLCFVEYFCVVIATVVVLESFEKALHERRLDPKAAAWPDILHLTNQTREFLEQHEANINDGFLYRIWLECTVRSRVNECIFWFDLHFVATSGRKRALQFVLRKYVPERIRINADSGARPAFRCCVFDGPNGVREVSWNSTDMGIPGESRECPVYMQNHVLEQLVRRIPFYDHLSVADSLQNPCFAQQHGDHFLVEYRYGEYKLGYFVGLHLAGRVLLKTFLFLTMQGTPESDLLRRNLRLTRCDIEFMHLDELSPFIESDVRSDAELTRIFQECGCGHLLAMQTPGFPEQCRRGYAESLRKYLSSGPSWHKLGRRLGASVEESQLIRDMGAP